MPVLATTESEVTFELIAKIPCSKFASVSLAQREGVRSRGCLMYFFDKRIDTLSFDSYCPDDVRQLSRTCSSLPVFGRIDRRLIGSLDGDRCP